MTVFSFGAGQESIYLLHRLIFDRDFYNATVKGHLVVVGSDTGNEHDHTYEAVQFVKQLCRENFIEFHWVTPDMGFHPKTWQSLTYQYERNSSIGSAAFRQTCTDNLKIKVVNNFIEQWLKDKYGYEGRNKIAYHKYMDEFNDPIRLILGFAAGEESRTGNGNKFDPKWKQRAMLRYFPLIEIGATRQTCIDYNEANIDMKIYPSNCKLCFYQSDQEVLWLFRNDPDTFYHWVAMEKKKLEKYAGVSKNNGVFGKITLEEKLAKAQKLYGDWSDERLDEYKYSHGHCIKSKY